MRIQHNIPAMNAYRNYNSNVKSLQANLQKLSSGYRINKAGDDAAGLAISEKMRAQITGLEVAQKNAKDGISLVQTAEGALTEVHDMLNRMYELAEQSANGTYADEVDREQMQKEIDSLRTEINRIADSTNFNGIKLLDGSMSEKGTIASEGVSKSFNLPETGDVLGVDTILHREKTDPTVTKFGVDLHDIKFDGSEVGNFMTIKVGSEEIKITTDTADAGNNAMTADDIMDVLTDDTKAAKFTITINGNGVTGGAGKKITDGDFTINGQEFKLSKGDNGRLMFEQMSEPTSEAEVVDAKMDVEITGTRAAKDAVGAGALTTVATDTDVAAGITGDGSTAQTYTLNLAGFTVGTPGMVKFTLGTENYEMEVTASTTADDVAAELATAFSGKFTDVNSGKYTAAAAGTVVTFTASGAGAVAAGNAANLSTLSLSAMAGTPTTAVAAANFVTGDYNKQTTEPATGNLENAARLASTVIKLKEDMISDGASVTIGNEEYTFSTDAADKENKNNKVYIGDMVGEGKSVDMKVLSERIGASAKDNKIWTVSGVAGKDGITLVEKTDGTGATTGNAAAKAKNGIDLSTEEGIAKTLGYKSGSTAAKEGKPLTLQIGDTADSYNKMTVDVNDCHAAAMGIGDIDISHQEGASTAMDAIKNAINYVSDTRGDLGAIQNRLDHTINNLSVAQENIQDAESTIRDVDVAEEMMAYTKNNILVQSAQAMLAQANQLPQGVLQLLG